MINNFQIKSISPYILYPGLILLLLLAPCNVRNYIQEELGLEKTEVTNRSKTTLSENQCDDHTENDLIAKSKSNSVSITPAGSDFISPTISDYPKEIENNFGTNHSLYNRSEIPFYILYQQLRVHLFS